MFFGLQKKLKIMKFSPYNTKRPTRKDSILVGLFFIYVYEQSSGLVFPQSQRPDEFDFPRNACMRSA